MFFDEIIYGTQYYRSPTPTPDEWEEDIPRLADYSLGVMQIRINWRWNERREGEYDFSDVDRLMDLAEKNGVKVVIKFLLECAPQYVFDKLGGTRIGPRGEQLRGGSHGAFYGGWRPCFTNPQVAAAAGRFCEEVAKRYRDRDCLILWNAWNEIRNKPMEDCFCPHCRREFGRYLKKKFGTVEALNKFYGVAEESFETIALPSTPHGFWDIFEFKKFKGGDNLYDYLKIVYDAVRKHDPLRPIMSHVGFTTAFQTTIADIVDDYTVKEAVDFWGTSIPCACNMDTPENRLDFMMLNDYMRSLDKNYFLHEIYPGLGMFRLSYDTPFDMSFKLYTALAGGARGLVFWQYRAERVGHENDCAGIVRADGSPRDVAYTVGDFGRELSRNAKLLAGAQVKPADVAIVFDFNSMLLGEIEDMRGADFEFKMNNPLYYYQHSHAGMYRLLRRCNYDVDYVGACYPERFKNYKVLYFPYYNMFDESIAPALEEYIREGGTVIADEGFGLREMNTWMQPYDIKIKPIATVRLRERRCKEAVIAYAGKTASVAPFVSEYRVDGSSVKAAFEDGTPALWEVKYGKGKLYLSAFPMGYSCYDEGKEAIAALVTDLLDEAGIEKEPLSDFTNGVYVKRLYTDSEEIIFLFNCTDADITLDGFEGAKILGGKAKLSKDKLTVPTGETVYVSKAKA